MACFLVPMGEAIVVTAIAAAAKKKEERNLTDAPVKSTSDTPLQPKLCLSRKLSWLCKLLWGGVLLLAVEHAWHGEIVPWPPFLTAMYNPADTSAMLHEMFTVGTLMAVFVTAVWFVMVLVADIKLKKIKTSSCAQTSV